MARKPRGTSDALVPESEQIFRYWVEVRDQRDGSTCALPLTVSTKLYLPTKKNEARRPAEDCLRVQDGANTLEARDLDEIAALLRAKYPDVMYEFRLNRERDVEAEQRRRQAMRSLAALVAKAAIAKLARE